jgi:hypothetical protein
VLEGSFRDVRIRGRPDFFAFEGKKALLLLDFKFSGGKAPFRDHEVQAEVYALLAGSMAFSTDELCFGIVMFPSTGLENGLRDAAVTKATKLQVFAEDGTLDKISTECEQARKRLMTGRGNKVTVESQGWKAFLYHYDPKKATNDLTWALGYWLGEREAIPVSQAPWDQWPRKCTACPLNAVGLCEHALEKPASDFRVQRNPDGRIFVFLKRGAKRAT